MVNDIRHRIAHLFSANGPKMLRDLGSLATGQVASMALGFAAFAYLARVLDPVAYGVIEYAIAVAALAAIVIECGAGTIGVRELAKRPDSARELAADVPLGRFALALLVVPLVGLSILVADLQGDAATLVWLYALSLLAIPFKQDWLLQGFERMTQAAVAQPIRMAVFAAGVFLLVRDGSDLAAVGVVEIASLAAFACYFLVAQYRWTVPFRFRLSLREPFYLLREGAAVGLSNALWVFMLYVPMIMLTSMVGGVGPAWLGAAQRMVISAVTLSFVYFFNLYPVITRMVAHDLANWGRVIGSSGRLVAWATIGFALGTVALREEIMGFVYGEAFVVGGEVLAVLIWVFPLRMMTGHARWSLIAAGHQRHLLIAEICGAAVLLVVGFLAIPVWEALGAALALLCGILTSGIVTQFAINRLVAPLSLLRMAFVPMVSAAAAIAAAGLISTNAFVQTGIAMAIYAGGALLCFRSILADLQRMAYAKAEKSTPA